jgi:hypothetical protein
MPAEGSGTAVAGSEMLWPFVCDHRQTMTTYYVTVDGDRVAGPFETRAAAKRRCDELNTNEVGGRYTVTSEG